MCLLDKCFKDSRRALDKNGKTHVVSQASIDELLVVAALAPILGTDLRAPIGDTLVASDACGGYHRGVGGVQTRVEPEVASELWRQRRRRGIHVDLSPPDSELLSCRLGIDFDPVDNDPIEIQRRHLVGNVFDALGWKPTFYYKPPYEHINISEARGVRSAVLREIKQRQSGSSLLVGCDSEVVTHGLAKGRTSAKLLKTLVITLNIRCLATGTHLGILPCPTDAMPADGQSRGRGGDRMQPKNGAPKWTKKFVAGNVAAWPNLCDDREQYIVKQKTI